ncbi:nuclear transport factor 2 family protein [Catenulispora sp. NF23]|uniref:Nuclear transport factor 2 family protein n=1 Tax=Catenulispora pinistramenti TaxID=2705254 RepID=A0ABS5KPT1_9ACTN|nr:nuclear transport factor 2 family protein [Catenulispora pinistramenti]MBS2539221.1 nuclear transport factor 2 family protein [Catenulispora pinistramenti]MBS2548016.1 nuclear transport factor 2 family protein [Catenulispora pinistramenti]
MSDITTGADTTATGGTTGTTTGTTATDAEAIVRAAYHAAEGGVLDVEGFKALFAEDGVFNNVVAGESYRGEHLGDLVAFMGQLAPDLHRDLRRFHVMGNIVAVELSIQGTVTGPFPTPAGVLPPSGAKLDIPTADFWYIEDGKVKEFNCYVGVSVMLAQLGVQPDFAGAVAASNAASAAGS